MTLFCFLLICFVGSIVAVAIIGTILKYQKCKNKDRQLKEEGRKPLPFKRVWEEELNELIVFLFVICLSGILVILLLSVSLNEFVKPSTAQQLRDAQKIEADAVSVDSNGITFVSGHEQFVKQSRTITWNNDEEIAIYHGKYYLFWNVYLENDYTFADAQCDEYKALMNNNNDDDEDTSNSYGHDAQNEIETCPYCGQEIYPKNKE